MDRYDPITTAHWMLDGLKTDLQTDTIVGPTGRPKAKTKTQAAQERLRFDTLCELLWNTEGRPGDLDDYIAEKLHAA